MTTAVKQCTAYSARLVSGFGLAALVGFGSIGAAQANTLNVPTTQYPTIQAGIDAANNGDTVLLADGTYQGAGNINLDYGGKSITVASQHGPAATILTGNVKTSGGIPVGVKFHTGEGPSAQLAGVTIDSCLVGIEIMGNPTASPPIVSSPTISNCVIQNNGYPDGPRAAGIIVFAGSGVTLTHCLLSGNGGRTGGGLCVDSSGGATPLPIRVTDCTFLNNTSGSEGGGLYCSTNNSLSIVDCDFIGNQAANGSGGGASILVGSGGSEVFTNCVFTGNTATASGGGVAFGGGGCTLTNCTFTGNAASSGAGVAATGGGCTLTNCILYGDSGPEILAASLTVLYSDVRGGAQGPGNVSADPQFNNATTDVHLRPTSPCEKSGTANGAPLTTRDGATRPVPPSIGAYEVAPSLLPAIADSYVTSSGSSTNYGSAPTLSIGGYLGAAYLQFDMSTVRPLASTSTVKLHLNLNSTSHGTGSLAVSAAGAGWTEGGLTFSSRPTLGLPLTFLTPSLNSDGQGGTGYVVDVTAYVKAQQAAGTAQIGLALTQSQTGLPVVFDSKENTAADGPYLSVTY